MVNQIFRLKDMLYVIRKHMNVIISMTLGGLLVGMLFYGVQAFSRSDQTMYKVFVSFSIDTSNEEGNFTNNMRSPGESDFKLASSLVDWVTYIVRSEMVCKTAVERLNLIGVTTKSVQNALSLTPYGDTSIMELVLVWHDGDEGVLIMGTVMDVLPSVVQSVLSVGKINIIEGPVVTTVSTPVGKKVIILFPALGILVSLLYCFAKIYLHPTLIDISDVGDMFGVNTLSVIDEDPNFEDFIRENLITNRESLSSGMKDNFITFAHILQHQIDDDYFSLFVTSSVRDEGRTMVVANLGIALAALDKRVLLIDFDLTSPTLGSYFMDEVDYRNTVNAVYFDDVSLDKALVRVSPNLYLLLASLDKRPIGIDRFAKKLVSQLEAEFDVIILDTPPLGENSDTLYFNSVSKNALYVIRYDYAGCDLIKENIEKLNKAGTSLLGAVVNRVTSTTALNLGKLASEPERRESPLSKALQKLPFIKKKEMGPKKKRLKADANRPYASDSFDSDDDLIDTEDFDAILYPAQSVAEPSAKGASTFRRKRTASLADDTDDERVARLDAETTEMSFKAPAPAIDAADQPHGDSQPLEVPTEAPDEAAEQKHVPAKSDRPAQKAAPAMYEEEDEDARFARIYGTAVNHLDGRDDEP